MRQAKGPTHFSHPPGLINLRSLNVDMVRPKLPLESIAAADLTWFDVNTNLNSIHAEYSFQALVNVCSADFIQK